LYEIGFFDRLDGSRVQIVDSLCTLYSRAARAHSAHIKKNYCEWYCEWYCERKCTRKACLKTVIRGEETKMCEYRNSYTIEK